MKNIRTFLICLTFLICAQPTQAGWFSDITTSITSRAKAAYTGTLSFFKTNLQSIKKPERINKTVLVAGGLATAGIATYAAVKFGLWNKIKKTWNNYFSKNNNDDGDDKQILQWYTLLEKINNQKNKQPKKQEILTITYPRIEKLPKTIKSQPLPKTITIQQQKDLVVAGKVKDHDIAHIPLEVQQAYDQQKKATEAAINQQILQWYPLLEKINKQTEKQETLAITYPRIEKLPKTIKNQPAPTVIDKSVIEAANKHNQLSSNQNSKRPSKPTSVKKQNKPKRKQATTNNTFSAPTKHISAKHASKNTIKKVFKKNINPRNEISSHKVETTTAKRKNTKNTKKITTQNTPIKHPRKEQINPSNIVSDYSELFGLTSNYGNCETHKTSQPKKPQSIEKKQPKLIHKKADQAQQLPAKPIQQGQQIHIEKCVQNAINNVIKKNGLKNKKTANFKDLDQNKKHNKTTQIKEQPTTTTRKKLNKTNSLTTLDEPQKHSSNSSSTKHRKDLLASGFSIDNLYSDFSEYFGLTKNFWTVFGYGNSIPHKMSQPKKPVSVKKQNKPKRKQAITNHTFTKSTKHASVQHAPKIKNSSIKSVVQNAINNVIAKNALPRNTIAPRTVQTATVTRKQQNKTKKATTFKKPQNKKPVLSKALVAAGEVKNHECVYISKEIQKKYNDHRTLPTTLKNNIKKLKSKQGKVENVYDEEQDLEISKMVKNALDKAKNNFINKQTFLKNLKKTLSKSKEKSKPLGSTISEECLYDSDDDEEMSHSKIIRTVNNNNSTTSTSSFEMLNSTMGNSFYGKEREEDKINKFMLFEKRLIEHNDIYAKNDQSSKTLDKIKQYIYDGGYFYHLLTHSQDIPEKHDPYYVLSALDFFFFVEGLNLSPVKLGQIDDSFTLAGKKYAKLFAYLEKHSTKRKSSHLKQLTITLDADKKQKKSGIDPKNGNFLHNLKRTVLLQEHKLTKNTPIFLIKAEDHSGTIALDKNLFYDIPMHGLGWAMSQTRKKLIKNVATIVPKITKVVAIDDSVFFNKERIPGLITKNYKNLLQIIQKTIPKNIIDTCNLKIDVLTKQAKKGVCFMLKSTRFIIEQLKNYEYSTLEEKEETINPSIIQLKNFVHLVNQLYTYTDKRIGQEIIPGHADIRSAYYHAIRKKTWNTQTRKKIQEKLKALFELEREIHLLRTNDTLEKDKILGAELKNNEYIEKAKSYDEIVNAIEKFTYEHKEIQSNHQCAHYINKTIKLLNYVNQIQNKKEKAKYILCKPIFEEDYQKKKLSKIRKNNEFEQNLETAGNRVEQRIESIFEAIQLNQPYTTAPVRVENENEPTIVDKTFDQIEGFGKITELRKVLGDKFENKMKKINKLRQFVKNATKNHSTQTIQLCSTVNKKWAKFSQILAEISKQHNIEFTQSDDNKKLIEEYMKEIEKIKSNLSPEIKNAISAKTTMFKTHWGFFRDKKQLKESLLKQKVGILTDITQLKNM